MSRSRTKARADSGTNPARRELASTALRSAKILDSHLQRLGIVYVRQSTPHQVVHHRESNARQYALVNHVVALGWPRERVLVIDEDQGQSGKSAEQRSGFHRLLAEVSMQHVGLIMGLEMSRLARSSRDWHHLLEMCALFGTILGDEDGIYNPNDSNDRLLLGLKGTISEFELVTMRNRLERGRLNKAQRGEMFQRVPVGYHKISTERIELEPDEQARGVVQLIFDKFDQLGSARAVFHYLLHNQIRVGVRPCYGPHAGQLQWRRPQMGIVNRILRHPIYAGAYAYGWKKKRRQRQRPSATLSGLPAVPPEKNQAPRYPHEDWDIIQRDRVPAYISWERYLANQDRLWNNRLAAASTGIALGGEALLAGLGVCGHCRRRLRARYSDRHKPHYTCERHRLEGRTPACHGLRARPLDELVSAQVLRALEPAALELSWQAVQDLEREHARLDRLWQQRLQRALYDVRDAERRYRAVDPDNRLVARTLEQNWEEALGNQRQLADDYDRFVQEKATPFSAEQRAKIEQLAADIPALWHAASTTAKDRKEIIRHLVEKVVVKVEHNSEHVPVTIHWHGGFISEHELIRPVARFSQLRDGARLQERMVALRRQGCTIRQIAERLAAEGFSPPKRGGKFWPENIQKMLSRLGMTKQALEQPLAKHEWRLPNLARELGIAAGKLRTWAERGWIHARQTSPQRNWVLWADRQELRRLRQLKRQSKPGVFAHDGYLTTPKKRLAVVKKSTEKQGNTRRNSNNAGNDVV
jgi:DNA invertase Pin-like site-specific DNA recombinase